MNEAELIYIVNTLLEDGLNFQNLEADTGRLPSFPKDLLAYVMASDDGALTPEGQILASAQSRAINEAGLRRQYM